MAIYALSGVIMIFRNTDFLKIEKQIVRTVEPGLTAEELGEALRIRGLRAESETEGEIVFRGGIYDRESGEARYTRKELPAVLKAFEEMHKATSDRPLFFLNVFFGVSLLFFVVSSFFMFLPKSRIMKIGLAYAVAGLALSVVMVYI
ncbi:hypothetical protein VDG1235_3240 [Verrucomicrobiia bacterium DG1235]|nr:hypothetical protein VDG1235_3240 [Verrucomicrobiae bacterium DG1235]